VDSQTRQRVRQHVNPFNRKYQQAIALPDWQTLYPNPLQPLHLDIGCARGVFLLGMAQQQPDWNFLGLEIREPIVQQAQHAQAALGLTNLHFRFCNVSAFLPDLLASLPPGLLQRVSIQFPDPWFKQRHRKRRVVQPEFVKTLATFLPPGGLVFLQSDVEMVAKHMRQTFQANPLFCRQHGEEWLAENPFPVQTEREQVTLSQGKPVYRALFQRSDRPIPNDSLTPDEKGKTFLN
jgi:tRNA (guanine-N7-)-methyltransferase